MDRFYDIVSNEKDLEPLFSIKQLPVFQGCVTHPIEQDLKEDLNFYISRSSGMVQLSPVLPLELIYQTDHNTGAIGQIWIDHHKEFSRFLLKYNPTCVFEIGGSHGILSKTCHDTNPNIDWTIIDPAPNPIDGLSSKIINGFFNRDTVIPPDVDMIVHSHVLEHIYDPSGLFDKLSQLPLGTHLCFSIPNLSKSIEGKFTNALSFEHTYFCTEEYVRYWLAKSRFSLIKMQEFGDHSVFYSAVRSETAPISMPKNYEKNKKLFTEFVDYHSENIFKLNQYIKNTTLPVYLFGGHVFSQALLAMGLEEESIVAVLDNSIQKQNRRLYGTRLTVYSPKILAEIDEAVVILQAGQYTEEIRKDIIDNINARIIFI